MKLYNVVESLIKTNDLIGSEIIELNKNSNITSDWNLLEHFIHKSIQITKSIVISGIDTILEFIVPYCSEQY